MNLLMFGFKSVYGTFVLDMSARSTFCGFVCPFIPLFTYAAGYPGKTDAIIFRKSVHFV